MIDWIIAQQGVLSIALALLIANERLAAVKLNPVFTYRLWALVPLVLILNNLPSGVVALASNTISRYVVGMNTEVTVPPSTVYFSVWVLGVCSIVLYVGLHHFTLWQSIDKQEKAFPNTHFSRKANTPMLFGFIAPKILLPYSFHSTFTDSQQALVLEHENMHLRHLDHVWNALALVLATVFWFNPLVWIALKSFRLNQELACDFNVLKLKSDNDKLNYAKALVQCAEHSATPLTLYPTFGEKTTMIKRINAIKTPSKGNKMLAMAITSVAILMAANTALANMPSQPVESNKAQINSAAPIKRVEPIYPKKAIKENLEGFVVFKFDISEKGAADKIVVVKSSPKGVFDKNALKAFKQWEFKPATKGGKPIRQKGLLVQLDFKLAPEPITTKNTLPPM